MSKSAEVLLYLLDKEGKEGTKAREITALAANKVSTEGSIKDINIAELPAEVISSCKRLKLPQDLKLKLSNAGNVNKKTPAPKIDAEAKNRNRYGEY